MFGDVACRKLARRWDGSLSASRQQRISRIANRNWSLPEAATLEPIACVKGLLGAQHLMHAIDLEAAHSTGSQWRSSWRCGQTSLLGLFLGKMGRTWEPRDFLQVLVRGTVNLAAPCSNSNLPIFYAIMPPGRLHLEFWSTGVHCLR